MFFIASMGLLYCFVWGAFWNSGTKHQVITVPARWNDVTIHTKPIWFNLFMCIRLVYKSSLCNRQLYKGVLFVFSDSHVSLENMSCFHLQKLDCVEDLVWYLLFLLHELLLSLTPLCIQPVSLLSQLCEITSFFPYCETMWIPLHILCGLVWEVIWRIVKSYGIHFFSISQQ